MAEFPRKKINRDLKYKCDKIHLDIDSYHFKIVSVLNGRFIIHWGEIIF